MRLPVIKPSTFLPSTSHTTPCHPSYSLLIVAIDRSRRPSFCFYSHLPPKPHHRPPIPAPRASRSPKQAHRPMPEMHATSTSIRSHVSHSEHNTLPPSQPSICFAIGQTWTRFRLNSPIFVCFFSYIVSQTSHSLSVFYSLHPMDITHLQYADLVRAVTLPIARHSFHFYWFSNFCPYNAAWVVAGKRYYSLKSHCPFQFHR